MAITAVSVRQEELEFLTVNGVRIAYQDAGSGEPLVLVHGSWGSHHNWDPVVPGLVGPSPGGHSSTDTGAQRATASGAGTLPEDVADLAALVETPSSRRRGWSEIRSGLPSPCSSPRRGRRPAARVIVHEPPLRGLAVGGVVADELLRMVLELIAAGDHAGAAEQFVEQVASAPALGAAPGADAGDDGRQCADLPRRGARPECADVDEDALARYGGPVLVTSGGQSPPIFQPVRRLWRNCCRRPTAAIRGRGPHPARDAPRGVRRGPRVRVGSRPRRDHVRRGRRLTVGSPDGTEIAVWVEGEGPAMVLVHGSHTGPHHLRCVGGGAACRPHGVRAGPPGLRRQRRRAVYSIEREFDDVAAVVDAVAERVGGPVALWGHSYGASGAMGATALTGNVSHLVLYEPSLGLPYPTAGSTGSSSCWARATTRRRSSWCLRDVLEFTDDQIEAACVPSRMGAPGRRGADRGQGGTSGGQDGRTPAPVQPDHRPDAAAVRLGEHAGDQAGHGRRPRPRSPEPEYRCSTVTRTSRTGPTRHGRWSANRAASSSWEGSWRRVVLHREHRRGGAGRGADLGVDVLDVVLGGAAARSPAGRRSRGSTARGRPAAAPRPPGR